MGNFRFLGSKSLGYGIFGAGKYLGCSSRSPDFQNGAINQNCRLKKKKKNAKNRGFLTFFADFRDDIQSSISQLLDAAQRSIFPLDHWKTLENLMQGFLTNFGVSIDPTGTLNDNVTPLDHN